MDQAVHLVTVATRDLDAARRFYGALGWEPRLDVPGEIVFYRSAAGQLLGLFDAASFARDAGAAGAPPATTGVTLSHNVGSRDAVVELVDAMVAAGGTVRKEPQEGEFGASSTPTSPTRTTSCGRSRTTPRGPCARTATSTSADAPQPRDHVRATRSTRSRGSPSPHAYVPLIPAAACSRRPATTSRATTTTGSA